MKASRKNRSVSVHPVPGSTDAIIVVADPAPTIEQVQQAPAPSEGGVPGWFTALLPEAKWGNWVNFLPGELAEAVGHPVDGATAVGIWKAGGKGMNVRKLVGALRKLDAAKAAAAE